MEFRRVGAAGQGTGLTVCSGAAALGKARLVGGKGYEVGQGNGGRKNDSKFLSLGTLTREGASGGRVGLWGTVSVCYTLHLR